MKTKLDIAIEVMNAHIASLPKIREDLEAKQKFYRDRVHSEEVFKVGAIICYACFAVSALSVIFGLYMMF